MNDLTSRPDITPDYLVASDFDQTLSFNDSGYALAEMLGISDFEEKVKGLSRSNLVQPGAELTYLLRHDPAFRSVRSEHLIEAGKRVRLKDNVELFAEILSDRSRRKPFPVLRNLCRAERSRELGARRHSSPGEHLCYRTGV